MSKLQELIDRLCPGGVPFKPFSDFISLETGDQFNKRDMNEKGTYPVLNGGINPSGYIESFNNEADTITISQGGASAGYVNWMATKFWAGAHCYVVSILNERILKRYVYFLLKNLESKLMNAKHGAGIPALNRNEIYKIEIPVPPIEIQEEIVKILDRFADYAAELQAELQARKEQYEYYRNLLLTFNPSACGCGTDGAQEIGLTPWGGHSYEVILKTMGEIGTFFGGLTGKSKSDFTNGNARFISYMNVYTNLSINQNMEEFVHIGEAEKQNVLEYGDALFTGSSETPEECGMSSVVTEEPKEPLYLNSFCFGFRLNDKNLFAPDFLKHLLRSKAIRTQITKTANGVTRFNVSKKLFAKIILPIPPIELQEKIAAILDRFEALVNDLTQGLPAEIAAVKEQYEYYRNKLLTFKKLA